MCPTGTPGPLGVGGREVKGSQRGAAGGVPSSWALSRWAGGVLLPVTGGA